MPLRALILASILLLSSAYGAAACGCSSADDPNHSLVAKCAQGCLAICGGGAPRVVCDGRQLQDWPQGLRDSKRVLELGAVLSGPASLQKVDLQDLLVVRSGESSLPLSALLKAPLIGKLAASPRAAAGAPISLELRRDARVDLVLSTLVGKTQ
jgi:hypothetical protein